MLLLVAGNLRAYPFNDPFAGVFYFLCAKSKSFHLACLLSSVLLFFRFTQTAMTSTSCGQGLTSSLTYYAAFKTSRRSTTFPGIIEVSNIECVSTVSSVINIAVWGNVFVGFRLQRAIYLGPMSLWSMKWIIPSGPGCSVAVMCSYICSSTRPDRTNWHAKTVSIKTSSECNRLMASKTSTLFLRPLCFPPSTRNSAVRYHPHIILFVLAGLYLWHVYSHFEWLQFSAFPAFLFFFSFFSSDCFAKDKGPWIIKPVASSRGRGIYLVSNVSLFYS